MLCSLFFIISTLYTFEIISSFVLSDKSGNSLTQFERREGKGFQLNPEYFDYPGLKEILSDISNSRQIGYTEPEYRVKPNKRQIDRENDAALFALRINPVIPRNPLSVKNYSRVCQHRKEWCAELPSPKAMLCPPPDTPPPRPTTCGPTKPPVSGKIYVYCNYGKSERPIIHDPCEECPTTHKLKTDFVACYSMPPPTAFARLKFCNPTTMPCHSVPFTYRKLDPLSTEPPPSPPRCDLGSVNALRNPDSKYYVLVKRSPGSWRAKRSRPRRWFRIVSETI